MLKTPNIYKQFQKQFAYISLDILQILLLIWNAYLHSLISNKCCTKCPVTIELLQTKFIWDDYLKYYLFLNLLRWNKTLLGSENTWLAKGNLAPHNMNLFSLD